MASAAMGSRVVRGRIDRSGKLIAADPELESLQREAGADIGEVLALPQLAAVAALAARLGAPVSRPAITASQSKDYSLWVHAIPDGDDILLSLEDWKAQPMAPPRLSEITSPIVEITKSASPSYRWSCDNQLVLTSVSPQLAELLHLEPDEARGVALTRLVQLVEGIDGTMPLIQALGARLDFHGQAGVVRDGGARSVILSGRVRLGPDGEFAGFDGHIDVEGEVAQGEEATGSPPVSKDPELDALLCSPLDRIIDSAEQIVARGDGPLRRDYANYGSDIAAAARHLISIVQSMDGSEPGVDRGVELTGLAAEASCLLEKNANERPVVLEIADSAPLTARGDEHAIIQILINLIGNAIRHSPANGTVQVAFDRDGDWALVSVEDEGPGIAPADQERIFEQFERADDSPGGSGLGLAIALRLARAMDGDIALDSAIGQGARFTLRLPLA